MLRRFRVPVPATVTVEADRPIRVVTSRRGLAGGRVETSAGPWRTSGRWWAQDTTAWNQDEWDVALGDGGLYRIFQDRQVGGWFIDGVLD
jgi:hypothetical protein